MLEDSKIPHLIVNCIDKCLLCWQIYWALALMLIVDNESENLSWFLQHSPIAVQRVTINFDILIAIIFLSVHALMTVIARHLSLMIVQSVMPNP